MLGSEYLHTRVLRTQPQTDLGKYNGMAMSILLNENDTRRHSGGRTDYHGSSSILPVCQPAPHTGASGSTFTGEGVKSTGSAWRMILPWSWMEGDENSDGLSSKDFGDKGTGQQMESHLCVDKCWSSTHDTRMITLESLGHMKCDYDYFRQARYILSQTEGSWLQRKLSWRSYTRVTLSRVCVNNFWHV